MLIGLTGNKGAGKDTAARYLIENEDYVKIAFADKLKEGVANLFDMRVADVDDYKPTPHENPEVPRVQVVLDVGSRTWPHPSTEYVFSWREFLQRFGTEMGRNTFGLNFWVDQWERSYGAVVGPVVATDVRFDNEALRIHKLGGYIVEIRRPGYEPDGHASEVGINRDLIDHTIVNDSTIEHLWVRMRAALLALEIGVTG